MYHQEDFKFVLLLFEVFLDSILILYLWDNIRRPFHTILVAITWISLWFFQAQITLCYFEMIVINKEHKK